MRLCTKKICPPRFNSRMIACRTNSSPNRVTRVSTARRSAGGVSRFEMSRTPNSDMCSVRGIGVAVIVSTSTVERSALSRSFTSTPNRCSSSITSRPRFANRTSGDARRCVPMRISTWPSAARSTISRCSLAVQNRDSERDFKRKLGHARCEGAAMLLGQHGGRHEHGHLVAGVDRLESGSNRQLRLAEAHVAAQQPVHRLAVLHVGLDVVDGRELVGRFLVRKRGVEFTLPLGVGRKRDARPGIARWPAARSSRPPDR